MPMALLGPTGRRVRCADCRHVWTAGTPEEEASAPPPPPQNPYTPPSGPISATGFEIDFDMGQSPPPSELPSFHDFVREGAPKKKMGAIPGKKAMLAAAVTAVIVLGAFLTLRGPLSAAAPFLEPVYLGLGMKPSVPANGAGIDRLVLRALRGEKGLEVEVSTKLLNLSEGSVDLSPVLIERIDAQGRPTGQKWRFPPSKSTLRPGEAVPFAQKVGPIEADAETVQLRARYVR